MLNMKSFVVAILLCLLAVTAVAQEQSPGSIEAILTIEDPTERIAALRKFLKTNNLPDQARTAKEALVASWAQIADSLLNNSELEKAMEAFDESIASLPEEISDTFFNDTVIRIPLALSLRGYRAQAVRLARELEPRCAGEGRRLAAIGEFYMTIEAPNDAIRALEEAFKAGEDTALLHRALGAAYRIGLRLDEAIAQYQQAIRLAPADKRAYYELGNLYRAFAAYPDAINLYRKQLELDPQHTSSYKGIALAHLAMGDESKATEALNKAREIRGAEEELTMDLYLQTQLAFIYLQRNNFPKARRAAEAALAIEPRYAWARLAAAEVDLAEGKYFEAERNLLAARPYASFPTLSFTFGKLYLAVEDFDGAIEQFAQAFAYMPADGFTSLLGGSLNLKAENLSDLLAVEHRAAIYLAESPTSPETFRIAQSLVRFNVRLGLLRDQVGRRPATRKQLEELDKDAMDFIEVENLRRSFRSLYISQRLAMAGVSTGTAAELADIALGLADIAVGPEGSLRDYPNFDFQGRLSIFKGRALDAKGWALFKSGKVEEAVETLSQSVAAFGLEAEGKRAIWHLATARETTGAVREALDLYIAGYQPPEDGKSTDINRTVIEVLYRKVNGSLKGLDIMIEKRQELSNRLVAELMEKYRPRTEKIAEAREPEPAPPAEKSGGLRLSLGPQDRSTQLRELSRIEQAERSSKPGLSPTDPMFARRESVRTERPKSEQPEAEPEKSPAINTAAARLPDAIAGRVRLVPIELSELLLPSSGLEELALRSDDLTPPAPPERKRLPVSLPDPDSVPVFAIVRVEPLELLFPSPDLEELALRSDDLTPPDPPQAHTRKRRVTTRDLQTQSTTTRKRRIKP